MNLAQREERGRGERAPNRKTLRVNLKPSIVQKKALVIPVPVSG